MTFRCLLWPMVFLVSGCAGHSGWAQRLAEVRAAARSEMLAQGTSWRSREGYGRTLWGMNQEDVIAVEPTAVATLSGLRVATSVAGNPAVALYRFSRKRLFSVSVDIDTPSPEIGYWELLVHLSAKYGGPDEKFNAYARWDGVQTVIELIAVESSQKAMTRIKYTSTVVVARPEGL